MTPSERERRRHAPWCIWEHDGSCPAENEPGPDHPVWARLERSEAAARDFRAVLAKMLVEAPSEVRCNCEDCTAAREALARHPPLDEGEAYDA